MADEWAQKAAAGRSGDLGGGRSLGRPRIANVKGVFGKEAAEPSKHVCCLSPIPPILRHFGALGVAVISLCCVLTFNQFANLLLDSNDLLTSAEQHKMFLDCFNLRKKKKKTFRIHYLCQKLSPNPRLPTEMFRFCCFFAAADIFLALADSCIFSSAWEEFHAQSFVGAVAWDFFFFLSGRSLSASLTPTQAACLLLGFFFSII